jgi:uncharacterized membrane protein YedE/YeeE
MFWQLVSIIICLACFIAVGTVLLMEGISFPDAVLRASAAFGVIYILQHLFGAIFRSAVGPVETKPTEFEAVAEDSTSTPP